MVDRVMARYGRVERGSSSFNNEARVPSKH